MASIVSYEDEDWGVGSGGEVKGLYLAAYLCHSLIVSALSNRPDYIRRFAEMFIPVLLASQDGECEQAACAFIAHYVTLSAELRQAVAAVVLDIFGRALSHRDRGLDEKGAEKEARCSPTVAARACAAMVTALGDTDGELVEQGVHTFVLVHLVCVNFCAYASTHVCVHAHLSPCVALR